MSIWQNLYLHFLLSIFMREGTVRQPILASIVNSFDSLAVPFFFIASGYFFFNRIGEMESESQKKEYASKYLLKTLKIYFIWSVALLPSRIILSKSGVLSTLFKWIRTFLFIGNAQLWYLNALLIGLVLILILKKRKYVIYGLCWLQRLFLSQVFMLKNS